MDFQRLILFGALGMVLLLLWQSWLEYEADKNGTSFNAATSAQSATTQGANNASGGSQADDVPQAPTASAAVESTDIPSTVPVSQSLPADRRVVVETDLIRAEIDTKGGDLRHLSLLT